MPCDSPIRVLILIADAHSRERAATALNAGEFLVTADLARMPAAGACQVLITDRAGDQIASGDLVQLRAGEGSPAVIGLGVTEHVDVELPVDFTGRELRLAVQLAAQIARLRAERDQLAAAHSAVRELAETDSLTGLPNRRAWERQVPALLTRAHRGGEPAWLALLDLDGFKQINDRLGMARGDEVLASCAQALSAALRRGDLVARLGGDEFGVLLVGVKEDRVLEIFERLRASVAAGGHVTVSIGLIAAVGDTTETELLRVAEIAMRAAKQRGGDQVVRASREGGSNDDPS